jgi:uncharacterized protein YegP (UPF0339 family)
MRPYFTVWQEHKTNGWRFTLWGANGRALFQSLHEYTTKRGAAKGCSSVVVCFSACAGGPHKEIYDVDGKLLN